jgi:hypothetical protein
LQHGGKRSGGFASSVRSILCGHLGLFEDRVKLSAVYGISEEPMSAEEWKKQYVKPG